MTRPLHHNKCIEGEKASINDSTSRDIKQTHYRPTSRSTGRHVGLNLSCVSARSEYSDDVPETGSCGSLFWYSAVKLGTMAFVSCGAGMWHSRRNAPRIRPWDLMGLCSCSTRTRTCLRESSSGSLALFSLR